MPNDTPKSLEEYMRRFSQTKYNVKRLLRKW